MTPKEKAKELVKRYEPLLYQGYGDLDGYIVAKKCALICIDELKKQSRSFDYNLYISRLEWLEEVKQEIEKL